MHPILVVNCKTYEQASGKNLTSFLKKLESLKYPDLYVAVDALDLKSVAKTKLKLLIQHIDPVSYGQFTGKIVPEEAKKDGAYGALINHAEDRLSFPILKKNIERAKEAKLKTIVCSASLKEIKKIIPLHPNMIAFEVPSLIGTGKSIAKFKPKSVQEFVKLLKNTKIIPLCGAGVSTKEDVESALKLGTKGVLIASAIVLAENPVKKIKEFL